MDKKSEEYLRQYIKLTDALKQKIEAHAARYHTKQKFALGIRTGKTFVQTGVISVGIPVLKLEKYIMAESENL